MSAITNQPSNINFLSPLGFKFTIKRAPYLNYFALKANVPSVSLGSSQVDTPFTRIPLAGSRLTFGNLDVTFAVDEDMKNYLEIFEWLKAVGFPDNFEQYGSVAGASAALTGEAVFSDLSLTVLSSAMNPIHEITYIDCFPIDLSELMFDSTSVDVQYITSTVTFAYRRFDIVTL